MDLNTTDKSIDRVDIDYWLDWASKKNSLPLKVVVNDSVRVMSIQRPEHLAWWSSPAERNRLQIGADYSTEALLWDRDLVSLALKLLFKHPDVTKLEITPEPPLRERTELAFDWKSFSDQRLLGFENWANFLNWMRPVLRQQLRKDLRKAYPLCDVSLDGRKLNIPAEYLK